MGKKKRQHANEIHEIPIFHAKKAKILMQDADLTALAALHKYCAKFKLGQVGYRQKRAEPYVITCVMDGQELGTAQQWCGAHRIAYSGSPFTIPGSNRRWYVAKSGNVCDASVAPVRLCNVCRTKHRFTWFDSAIRVTKSTASSTGPSRAGSGMNSSTLRPSGACPWSLNRVKPA